MVAKNVQIPIILLIIFTIKAEAQLPYFEWASTAGGSTYDAGQCITTDTLGNVYVTGSFEGTVDFDPGEGVFNLTAKGERDAFVQKLNANGDFVWAYTIEGVFSRQSITTDASGNVYVAGYFTNTVDFDPGENTYNLTANGKYNAFIQKLDNSGNLLWVKSIETQSSSDSGPILTVDIKGNIYISGDFRGTVDFDPGAGTYDVTAEGNTDHFILKLSTSGDLVWVKKTEYVDSNDIALDGSGNIHITGYFGETVDLDPGAEVYNVSSIGSWDTFVLKLSASGDFLWARSVGGTYNDWHSSIAIDASGNVYVTGTFLETADFDPGEGVFNMTGKGDIDSFVLKLDASGNFVWAKKPYGYHEYNATFTNSITIDTSGYLYITGGFLETVDFDMGEETFDLTSNEGSLDIYLQKIDTSGNLVWVKAIGGANGEMGQSVSVDDSGNIYITGDFERTADFNPGEDNIEVTSQGDRDIFVLKLSQCTPTSPVPDVSVLEDLVTNCSLDTLSIPTATNNCGEVFTATTDISFPITSFDTTTIVWTFSDDYGNTVTQTQNVIIKDVAPSTLTFEAPASICHNENYKIEYTGVADGEASWDFDGASIVSGTDVGPYTVSWTSAGKKSVYFSINNQGCIRDTTILVTVTPETAVPEICMVTVDEETDKNLLNWNSDAKNIKSFGVYRETNVADEYTLIDVVDAKTFSYIDDQSLPTQQSNRYKITALDSCGAETELSNFHKTIHLTINKGLGNSWNLIWDGYEGISFGTYRIYRGADEKSLELLTEIASNLTSFTDTEAPEGSIYYQIEVLNSSSCIEESNGRIGSMLSSKSNIARSNTITGTFHPRIEPSIELYPNPTSGMVYLQDRASVSRRYSIQDIYGKEIHRGLIEHHLEIDFNSYPSGVYFLKVQYESGVQTRKVVKR